MGSTQFREGAVVENTDIFVTAGVRAGAGAGAVSFQFMLGLKHELLPLLMDRVSFCEPVRAPSRNSETHSDNHITPPHSLMQKQKTGEDPHCRHLEYEQGIL